MRREVESRHWQELTQKLTGYFVSVFILLSVTSQIQGGFLPIHVVRSCNFTNQSPVSGMSSKANGDLE